MLLLHLLRLTFKIDCLKKIIFVCQRLNRNGTETTITLRQGSERSFFNILLTKEQAHSEIEMIRNN